MTQNSNGKQRPSTAHASVGIVQEQRMTFDFSLPLERGGTLEGFTLAYETYGTLNADASNAILICHALSGDAHVAGYYTDDPNEKPGWWDEAVGAGKMFDTNRFFVICSNVIGGCRGSTGPSSFAADGRRYGARFPVITIADMVRAQHHLIQQLGIQRLFAVAGGSMGGMQALQWAVSYPDHVAHVLFIASTPRASAQNIAFNEIGRQAIYADPYWNNGDYYDGIFPKNGLAVARMVGHITYMSETSLAEKFGRVLSADPETGALFPDVFAVESYLQYQGKKFVERFDANSYLYITRALDYFDISAGYASMTDALQHVRAKFLIISFTSDWLYTYEQAQELADGLRANGCTVDHHHIQSHFGHDSFLVEVETMSQVIGDYLRQHSPLMQVVGTGDDNV